MQGFIKTLTHIRCLQNVLIEGFRGFHLGSTLCAEPLKKKKRVDPHQEQNRIRRKSKRIEREIKRLAKQGKKLKPVEEIEGDRTLMKEQKNRQRDPVDLSMNEVDRRALLLKEWTRFQCTVARKEQQIVSSVQRSQQRALKALAEVSPNHLYLNAIQPEMFENGPLCIKAVGPYATPPIPADLYEAPDGDKCDKTPKFEYDFQLDRRLLAEAKRGKFITISGKKQVQGD